MRKESNAHVLVFYTPAHYTGRRPGLGSSIKCATAGGSGVGRSATLRCLHLSEFAFWPGDKRETLAGLSQAVPDKPGTMIIIESTANGGRLPAHLLCLVRDGGIPPDPSPGI